MFCFVSVCFLLPLAFSSLLLVMLRFACSCLCFTPPLRSLVLPAFVPVPALLRFVFRTRSATCSLLSHTRLHLAQLPYLSPHYCFPLLTSPLSQTCFLPPCLVLSCFASCFSCFRAFRTLNLCLDSLDVKPDLASSSSLASHPEVTRTCDFRSDSHSSVYLTLNS